MAVPPMLLAAAWQLLKDPKQQTAVAGTPPTVRHGACQEQLTHTHKCVVCKGGPLVVSRAVPGPQDYLQSSQG